VCVPHALAPRATSLDFVQRCKPDAKQHSLTDMAPFCSQPASPFPFLCVLQHQFCLEVQRGHFGGPSYPLGVARGSLLEPACKTVDFATLQVSQIEGCQTAKGRRVSQQPTAFLDSSDKVDRDKPRLYAGNRREIANMSCIAQTQLVVLKDPIMNRVVTVALHVCLVGRISLSLVE
jgi:hypothetical protein